MTKSYLKLVYEGGVTKFRVYKPDSHATAYAYNVANLFFSNVEDAAVVVPNHIYMWAYNATGTDWIAGEATDAGSIGKIGDIPRHYMIANLNIDGRSDQTTLNSLASGILAKVQGEMSQGTLVAPMHCSQELFDKITVTDSRYGTPKVTTGYVHRIVREYDRGVYRITLQLGGVTSGYIPAGGGLPTPLAGYEAPPAEPRPPVTFDYTDLPKAIQGFYHDIIFTADSQTQVSWTAVNGIKFYDGTTQAIASGNTGTLGDSAVRYIYFNLQDASPNVLKVTTDYQSIMTEFTGVVCVCQRGSDSTVKATFFPSFGKTPLITADMIYLTGLLDKLPDGTYGKVLSTKISSGSILCSGLTEGGGYRRYTDTEMVKLSGIATGADVTDGHSLSVLTDTTLAFISDVTDRKAVSANEKSGASEGYNFLVSKLTAYGLSIYTTSGTTRVELTANGIKGLNAGTTQFELSASTGKATCAAGYVIIDASGIAINNAGATTYFKVYNGSCTGYFYAQSANVQISTISGSLTLGPSSDLIFDPSTGVIQVKGKLTASSTWLNHLYDIHPYNTTSWLGTSSEKWSYLYVTQIGDSSNKVIVYCNGLTGCPMPAPSIAALEVIKSIKPPVEMEGHFGFGKYFNVEDFPEELKMDVIEHDEITKEQKPIVKKDIEIIRTVGMLVQAVRELTVKVEELEGRIP